MCGEGVFDTFSSFSKGVWHGPAAHPQGVKIGELSRTLFENAHFHSRG